jgi:hypothetical protein
MYALGLTKLDNVRSSGEDGRHNAIEKEFCEASVIVGLRRGCNAFGGLTCCDLKCLDGGKVFA